MECHVCDSDEISSSMPKIMWQQMTYCYGFKDQTNQNRIRTRRDRIKEGVIYKHLKSILYIAFIKRNLWNYDIEIGIF